MGRTSKEKQEADCRLLHNLYILIEGSEEEWLKGLRYNRAENYYEMVMVAGHRAFWKDKEVIV